MNDRSTASLVKRLEQADAEAREQRQEYRREMLKDLLPEKYWNLVKDYGEPNVDSDPDLQSIAASHCAYIIAYVAKREHDADRAGLEIAHRRESHSAVLFTGLATARKAVIEATTPRPPLLLEPPTEQEPDPDMLRIERVRSFGYDPVRVMPSGKVAGIRSTDNGWTLFSDITDMGIGETFTYVTPGAADRALQEWDDRKQPNPPGPFILPDAEEDSEDAPIHQRSEAGRRKARA